MILRPRRAPLPRGSSDEVAQSVQKMIRSSPERDSVDLDNSGLSPTQNVYLGARFQTGSGRLHLLEYRIDKLVALVTSFSKVGVHNQLSYLSLLGLRVELLQFGGTSTPSCMRPIQWYLRLNQVTYRLRPQVLVNKVLAQAL